MTDERRPRPNSSPREQPVTDEEFRAALDRETDLSLREDHRGELLTWNGETLTVATWSQRTGIQVRTLLQRCRKGWSVEQVLTTPPGGDLDD